MRVRDGSTTTRRGDLLLGGVIAAMGMVAGATMFGDRTPEASAAQRVDEDGCACLPVATIGANEAVVAPGPNGILFLIDSRGAVAPIRYRDTDLRNIPGETFFQLTR